MKGKLVAALLAPVVFSGLSACGDSGKWVEAPDTLTMYERMDRARRMMENDTISADGRSCAELLGQMQEHIESADSGNIMFQQMVRNCGDIGMQFGAEVRCESGRLQVRCE
tara:strand:+ start:66425 stop:66757 length:333 start_codon:yes stop_codon:yes gene_type:complete